MLKSSSLQLDGIYPSLSFWPAAASIGTGSLKTRSCKSWLLQPLQKPLSTSTCARASQQQGPPASGRASTSVQQSTGAASAQQPRYSPLHFNVVQFCDKIVLTDDERKFRQQIVETVRQTAKKALADAGARVDVQVFGSFASGLSTWSSDVDLVVTGVMEPDRVTGVYDIADRGRVTAKLRRIGEALRRNRRLDNPRISIIPRARIPIIKLKIKSVNVDISISDDTGVRAARYLQQQAAAYPPMRPLVLVLKAYLRSCGLNDVAYGGLSSYSLCNMVVAHLQEELKAGRDIHDLGETLYSFLLRYGEEFDYGQDAVSVRSGGIVPKRVLGHSMESARMAVSASYYDQTVPWYERLTVDCPLTGRDVSNGTYRIDAVRAALERASRKLEALARGRRISDDSINYLQALFDVNRITKRSMGGIGGDYQDDFIAVIGQGTNPARDELQEEEILEGAAGATSEDGGLELQGLSQSEDWVGGAATSRDGGYDDDDSDDSDDDSSSRGSRGSRGAAGRGEGGSRGQQGGGKGGGRGKGGKR